MARPTKLQAHERDLQDELHQSEVKDLEILVGLNGVISDVVDTLIAEARGEIQIPAGRHKALVNVVDLRDNKIKSLKKRGLDEDLLRNAGKEQTQAPAEILSLTFAEKS